MAQRLAGRCGYPKDEPFRVTLHPERLEEPLHWRKPRRIFVCSMGDLFHEDVPDEFLCRVWNVFRQCHADDHLDHRFLVLTKRPERMTDFVRRVRFDGTGGEGRVFLARTEGERGGYCLGANYMGCSGLNNVWLGVTAENQETADQRIPPLLQCPAAVRFVSYEPALGPVAFWALNDGSWYDAEGATRYNALTGTAWWGGTGEHGIGGGPRISWLIAGAETGPGARPADPEWFIAARDQCEYAGVPFFFKRDSNGRRTLDGLMYEEWPDA